MPPSRHVVAATIRFLYRLRGLSLARWATALAPTPSGCGILKAREQELPAQGSRCGLGARTRSPRALARHFGSASARCARVFGLELELEPGLILAHSSSRSASSSSSICNRVRRLGVGGRRGRSAGALPLSLRRLRSMSSSAAGLQRLSGDRIPATRA